MLPHMRPLQQQRSLPVVRHGPAGRFRFFVWAVRAVGRGASILTGQERVKTEHEEQRELVRWFRRSFPCVRIFAIPNGEHRSKTSASRLKAEGVSAGVPDLFIPAWRCWIEMKRQSGGRLSAEQKDWIEYLSGIGDVVHVARGADEAKHLLASIALARGERAP